MFIMLSRQRLKVALQNRWRLLSQDLMRYVLYNSAALVLVFFSLTLLSVQFGTISLVLECA
jgi:hypothetical protein